MAKKLKAAKDDFEFPKRIQEIMDKNDKANWGVPMLALARSDKAKKIVAASNDFEDAWTVANTSIGNYAEGIEVLFDENDEYNEANTHSDDGQKALACLQLIQALFNQATPSQKSDNIRTATSNISDKMTSTSIKSWNMQPILDYANESMS